jgi:hypothetical protein
MTAVIDHKIVQLIGTNELIDQPQNPPVSTEMFPFMFDCPYLCKETINFC